MMIGMMLRRLKKMTAVMRNWVHGIRSKAWRSSSLGAYYLRDRSLQGLHLSLLGALRPSPLEALHLMHPRLHYLRLLPPLHHLRLLHLRHQQSTSWPRFRQVIAMPS